MPLTSGRPKERVPRAPRIRDRTRAFQITPPGLPANYVDRPRLRAALESAVPLGVALIVAPGGFGKTVVLADFAQRAPFPFAWLTISLSDRDLVAFVDSLVASIGIILPRTANRAMRIARQGGSSAMTAAAIEIASEIAENGGPIGIVIDDFHLLDGASDATRFMSAFVEHMPSNCFLAVSSRTVPALPHTRLLAAGRIKGVPADDFRFTLSEVAELLHLEEDNDSVASIHAATNGWVAALRIGSSATSFTTALGSYFTDEVLRPFPPEMHQFLLRASVPLTLTRDTCERLLSEPDGMSHLEMAHQSGLFVSLAADNSYRLHDLFRDFLRERFRRVDHAGWHEVNRIVADEMVQLNLIPDAITLLLDADLPRDAAEILVANMDHIVTEGRWGALRQWTGALPPRILRGLPRLHTLRGRALHVLEPELALPVFDRAVFGCESLGDTIGMAEALAHRAERLSLSGQHDAGLIDARRAQQLVADVHEAVVATILRIVGTITARMSKSAVERLEALEILNRALTASLHYRARVETAMCERALGWTYSISGDAFRASAHYERAVLAWTELQNLNALSETLVSLGHSYREGGAAGYARARFEEALIMSEKAGRPRAAAFALDNLAILDREDGLVDQSLTRLDKAIGMARRLDDAELLIQCLDQQAQCHRLLPGGLSTGETLARQSIVEAERNGYRILCARSQTTLAAILIGQERPIEALTNAQSAIEQLQITGPWSDLMRARIAASVAGQIVHAGGWAIDLRDAVFLLEQVTHRGFLRAEIDLLGDWLRSVHLDPIAGPAARALFRAVKTLAPTVMPPVGLPEEATPAFPRIEVTLFGRPNLTLDGVPPMDKSKFWNRSATRELFYLLEAHRGGLTGDEIIARIWPDGDLDNGKQQLWTVVHRVRTALGGHARSKQQSIIVQSGAVYRLNPDLPIFSDAAIFEASIARSMSASRGSESEIEALQAADRLYVGEYLAGHDAHWTLPLRGRFARSHIRVLTRLVELALEQGRDAEAILFAERLHRNDPYAEAATRLLLQALMKTGDRDRARGFYRSFARRMIKTLDTPPSPDLAAMVNLKPIVAI